jgi:hypothetical protein
VIAASEMMFSNTSVLEPVRAERFLGLLDTLLDRGFLHKDETLLSIGPEAQRLWGGRNSMELLSVIDTPELYTVLAGNQELGVLHELNFRRVDAVVLLGGRSWRVSFHVAEYAKGDATLHGWR